VAAVPVPHFIASEIVDVIDVLIGLIATIR
jgi:hypothetical protein